MPIAANQSRTFLRLLAQLRPHWRRDAALPARIQTILARQRTFGARDRRLYRELIYTAIRHLPWIEPLLDSNPDEAVRRVAWLCAETPATRGFRAAFATGEPVGGDKSELLPVWFRSHCPGLYSGAELETQFRRAPLWLRLQTDDPQSVFDEFDERGWKYRRSAPLEDAVELLAEADVTQTDAWREGRLEVQDLGSQMILETLGIEPGTRWLDACAGAGGKTLQLARLLGSGGAVEAHDVRPAAIAELAGRAARARMECHLISDTFRGAPREPLEKCNVLSDTRAAPITAGTAAPQGSFDGVLVDAPCSGSGTWRRAPHLKWITTEAHVARAAEKQLALLTQFSANVRLGGRLVYATCSLSSRENEEVVAAFLAAQPEFRAEPPARTFDFEPRGNGLTLMPSRHDTDGFFVASLRRRQGSPHRA